MHHLTFFVKKTASMLPSKVTFLRAPFHGGTAEGAERGTDFTSAKQA